jgi:hypothetical protein
MTSDEKFNLQIQANSQAKLTSVRDLAPKTVAGPVIVGNDKTAEEVRSMFIDKMLI